MRRLRSWPIGSRIVLVVTLTMAALLLLGSGFVFWRVRFALDRQLDTDLAAYDRGVTTAVERGGQPVPGGPDEWWQLYTPDGRIVSSGASRLGSRLASAERVQAAVDGPVTRYDAGGVLPGTSNPARVSVHQVSTPAGPRVIAIAIGRDHRDEALRELLGQLLLADAAVVVGAALLGFRTARLALDPVERYRRAAADAEGRPGVRLPVPDDRDDELTRLGHTLNRMLSDLEAASERERRFLADASHELRTPLSLMRAEVDYALLRPRSASELTVAMESLAGHVSRLTALATTLLDLERLQVDAVPPRTSTDLDRLVREVTGTHRDAERPIAVDTACGTADVVEAMLRIAVDNLVTNAVVHGSGSVTVMATRSAGEVVIEVTDEGGGLPADFAPYAFERFTRADTNRSAPGSGLGLALVGEVARLHGGSAQAVPGGVRLRLAV